MDVRRLELLRELSERGSVTAVARATNRTASAVSQQLKVLEREAGIPLTEPAGRGIRLTHAGRMLARTAADVAAALERADAIWREFAGSAHGVVTLTTFPTGGQMLLPGVLTRVAEVDGLTLTCTDQDPLVPDFADLTGDFDIVLVDAPGVQAAWRERGLAVVKLFAEPLDVALPEGHRLARKKRLVPADLVGEEWIGVPPGFPYDRILQRIAEVTGAPANITQRFLDNLIVEAVVAAGHGIAILPRFTTREHENGLVTRPLDGVSTERVIFAILRPELAERPSVRVVLDALKEEGARIVAAHPA